MRVFKTRSFYRWAKEQKLKDEVLRKAVQEIEEGLYEANLGGSVYKKRISIGNRGKSSGSRTIVAFKLNNKAFFIYGFAKNKRSNITLKEELALKMLAKLYFTYDEKQIDRAIKIGELIEVLL
ncbi:MAG: type II toxin-antitoxin system RelE/ParE family toxin [Gammaproteobacteria bacterium]|nr:MAG: type II toxin-antitoxin system RelE/ParE family toxin [Gammaproteobacteria bacterium]